MSIDEVSSQLNQIIISNQNFSVDSPPAKLTRSKNTRKGVIAQPVVLPLGDRQSNAVTCDPALPAPHDYSILKKRKIKNGKRAKGAKTAIGTLDRGKTRKKSVKRVLERDFLSQTRS